ncbi:MAG: SPASM domain-containing protein, partial [Bacilli bacterium]
HQLTNVLNEPNVLLKEHLYLNKDKEFIWPSLNNPFITKEGTCYGLRKHLAILVDGTVVPCCLDSKGIIKLGNIYKEDFKDIINSNKVNNIFEGFKNNQLCEELCQKCQYRTRFKK